MADFWLALVIGLALGGAAGWLLRSRAFSAQDVAAKDIAPDAEQGQSSALRENARQALEGEIEALRKLLQEQEKELAGDAAAEALDQLDQAIKRANGRLKLLDQSLQRVQDDEKQQEN